MGDPTTMVTGVASVEDAEPGDLVLAESPRFLKRACESQASAVIASQGAECVGKAAILVPKPRLAFAQVLRLFERRETVPKGIDPTCRVGERLASGQTVSVGAFCWLGDDVTLGEGVILHPMVYVGSGCRIGEGTEIFANASVMADCEIGARVRIHSGTVIGADGFGYERDGSRYVKVPQVGRVVIGDDVEIGACSTVDRAKTGVTEIGAGTKIDNLVHIAHNVRIGRNCIIVALTGISGSVRIGDGVVFGGQAGVKDHVTVGDGAVIAARAGVIGNVPAGVTLSGFPARDHSEEMQLQAQMRRLPELVKRIRDLEEQIRRLQSQENRNEEKE